MISRRELSRAARGSYSEWRAACERARDSGWTMSQVEWVLWASHPFTYIVGGLLVLALVIVTIGVATK